MKIQKQSSGFTAIEAIIVIVVVAAVGLGGWLVWRHNHQQKKAATSSNSSTTQNGKQSSSGTQTADPYAGWKSYCDYYNYCFKYPADWALTVQTAPQQPGAAGQITLTNPGDTVELSYMNVNNHDGAIASFTPAVPNITLTTANQNLSIIGGYQRLSNSYFPAYDVIDTSMLTSHPLTVGQETQIPQPPEFTDQGTGNTDSLGSFRATPAKPLSSLTDAKAWFTSADAQTGLQVLKSFSYKP